MMRSAEIAGRMAAETGRNNERDGSNFAEGMLTGIVIALRHPEWAQAFGAMATADVKAIGHVSVTAAFVDLDEMVAAYPLESI